MTTQEEKTAAELEAATKAAAEAAGGADQKTQAEANANVDEALANVNEAADREANPDEFPTDWHRDRFISDTQREIAGAKARGDKDALANAERELARLTGGKTAKQTRPRGGGAQTRS